MSEVYFINNCKKMSIFKGMKKAEFIGLVEAKHSQHMTYISSLNNQVEVQLDDKTIHKTSSSLSSKQIKFANDMNHMNVTFSNKRQLTYFHLSYGPVEKRRNLKSIQPPWLRMGPYTKVVIRPSIKA